THGVLCDSPRDEKLQQVIGSARLGADSGHLESAKGLTLNESAGDFAVDVQVADLELALGPGDVLRAARKDATGQGVGRAVGDGESLAQVAGFQNGKHGSEDLLLSDDRLGIDVGKNIWRDKVSLLGER